MSTLYVQKLTETAMPPSKANVFDAGYDVYADYDGVLHANQSILVSTGISIALPRGHYGRIASRSSLAVKGIEVGAGVIDEGYRGELKVLLRNFSDYAYHWKRGERIAQIIVTQYTSPAVVVVENLPSSDSRGVGGFGSSGV